MNAPNYLNHKPHLVVNDYEKLDGIYQGTVGTTDARALSLGEAQYDNSHFSAKVFRHTGSQWSRQSEELPIHRVLDLTILVISSMLTSGASLPISILGEKDVSNDNLRALTDYYAANMGELDIRLDEIKRLINLLKP